MKRSLLFFRLPVFILFLCYFINTEGQTVIFSEDFSGFGGSVSHGSPSTTDSSPFLDSKTQIPGWTGTRIYSAGGEIKLGTLDFTGWIETPTISFAGFEGTIKVRFDICRWTADATSVRILLDGTQIGSTLTPGDNFETVEIPITSMASSGKIKFESVSKRFYLDNVSLVSTITSTDNQWTEEISPVLIFPNPVKDKLTLRNISEFEILEVLDISGKIHIQAVITGKEEVQLYMPGLQEGIYIIRLSSGRKVFTKRLVKMNLMAR